MSSHLDDLRRRLGLPAEPDKKAVETQDAWLRRKALLEEQHRKIAAGGYDYSGTEGLRRAFRRLGR